ncbi:urea transporter 1-like isoform X2 [Prorops nasuta]|uniref:urea transporter 1-like isoform X2 n=1 Tax=Prorops nasuta TaxID=863751 RepID=UPI0034CEC03F
MPTQHYNRKKENNQYAWPACVGDFSLLKEYLAKKNTPSWVVLQLLDALLRGFGQLMKDSEEHVANGLTVYNPLLIGVVSYALVPKFYGAFDSFSFLLILLGTILSVYLMRSLETDKFPCTTWPFNLTEFALLFALATQNNLADGTELLPKIFTMENATIQDAANASVLSMHNSTVARIDWGMIFRGIVVSASQVYAVDNVATASIVYLAILIYSPATAGFSFLGSLIGAFAGLELGVANEEIYSGLWGFNSLLTGAALGGNLIVLNFQTAAATLVAIVYTTIVQYAIHYLFVKINLPILTLPFVIVVSLFAKLRESTDGSTFPRPVSHSFPEKQRYEYYTRNHCTRYEEEPESETQKCLEEKVSQVEISC